LDTHTAAGWSKFAKILAFFSAGQSSMDMVQFYGKGLLCANDDDDDECKF